MVYLIIGLYIPSFVNVIYMHTKKKKLHLEFDKKLKDKGYEKTDANSNLVSLISDAVVDREEYAARVILSIFPITNLYAFVEIITKKLDKEYKAILGSLDNKEVLDALEEDRYIYNQNTILKGKENIVNKMGEMSKTDEPNNTASECIEISTKDSLEQMKQKKALLDEMIYIRNLEIAQAALSQKNKVIVPMGVVDFLEDDPTLTEKRTIEELEGTQSGIDDSDLEKAYRAYQKVMTQQLPENK